MAIRLVDEVPRLTKECSIKNRPEVLNKQAKVALDSFWKKYILGFLNAPPIKIKPYFL